MTRVQASAVQLVGPPERRRAARAAARRRRRRTGVGFAVMLTLLVGGWELSKSSFFAVSRIEVVGTKLMAPSEVVGASGLRVGQSVLWVHPEAVAARIRALDLVRDVVVRRVGVSVIRIEISERAAALEVRMAAGRWYFDRDGRPISLARPPGGHLPVLIVPAPPTAPPGADPAEPSQSSVPTLPPGVVPAIVDIWGKIPAWLSSGVRSFTAPSADAISFPWGKTEVFFAGADRVEEKIAALRAIADAAKRQHRALRRVDLRAPAHPAAVIA